ncbi:MAG: hypothetical protein ABIG10_00200 [bacterium]
MEQQTFVLRPNVVKGEFGDFKVVNLPEQDQIFIELPNRNSFHLDRFGDKIQLSFDLGKSSSSDDLLNICNIDLSKADYSKAITYSESAVSRFLSANECLPIHLFVKRKQAVAPYVKPPNAMGPKANPTGYFGRNWVDQVYVRFEKADIWGYGGVNNIAFDILREDGIDIDSSWREYKRPLFHLLVSLKLKGRSAQYFLFIRWVGQNYFWAYQKIFFLNNNYWIKM